MHVLIIRIISLISASATLAFMLAGCNQVSFQPNKSLACYGSGLGCTAISDTVVRFDYHVRVNSGMVDILIIDDNSGSMSGFQSNLAARFPTFISSLGSLDYHLAITTTDVSASNSGPSKYMLDGNFIPFASGVSILTRDNPSGQALFANTIQRPETLACEQSGYQDSVCPSGDERAVYAARLAVERRDPSFFRNDAHFALVILSDEDERSTGGTNPDPKTPLEPYDLPANLVTAVKANLGAQKTFSTHAIIIQSGDTSCYSQDFRSFNLHGSYGVIYEQLVSLTGGNTGSVCASDYGAQLGNIGYNIVDQVHSKGLVCSPLNNKVDVTLTPQPAGVTVSYDATTNAVKFSQTLPPNTDIHLVYDCTKIN